MEATSMIVFCCCLHRQTPIDNPNRLHSSFNKQILSFMPDNPHNRLNDLDPDVNFFNPLHVNDLNSSSNYQSIHDFKQLDVNKSTTLSIVHLNVCIFGASFDKFRALFAYCNLVPDILLLSETWFTQDSSRELGGYKGHHVTRRNRRGGGMSVFVNDIIS